MEGIRIKFEVQICHGCLSTDRRLSRLGHLSEILSILVGTIPKEPLMHFCWECMAILRKMEKFRNQLKQAQDVMQKIFDETHSLSRLSNMQTRIYNQEIYHPDTINIHERDSPTHTDAQNIREVHSLNDEITNSIKTERQELVQLEDNLNLEDPIDNSDRNQHVEIYNSKQTKVNQEIYHPDTINIHERDIPTHTDVQNIREEHSLNDEITNSIKTERQDIVELEDDNFKNSMNNSDRNQDVEMYNPKQTKVNKRLNKEYHTYTYVITQRNRKKPYIKYFDEVYLDEINVEDSFLQNDRTRHGHKMKFNCKSCSLGYYRKIDFYRHINLNHHKPKSPYKCLHCKEVRPSLYSLNKHWRSHSLYYKCYICYEHVSKRQIAIHIDRCHVNVYACPNCTKTFGTLALFSEHYNKNHPFICDYCDKNFALRSALEKHIKNHHILL